MSETPVILHLTHPHLCWLSQPELGTYFPSTGTVGWREQCEIRTPWHFGGTFTVEIFLSILICHMRVWDQPILCFCPSYLCQGGLYCMSPVIGVLFSEIRQFPMMAFLYFSCNFYVVVKEDKQNIFLLFILTGSFSHYSCQFLFQKNLWLFFQLLKELKSHWNFDLRFIKYIH